jgi:DNA-binding protein H-NS
MPHVNLDEFSIEELNDLRNAIDHEKIRRQEEERERLLSEIQDAATRYGMSTDDFLKTAPRKRRASASLKYRNPANPKEVWSGRGRKPTWVEEAIAAGTNLADLEVHGAVPAQVHD